jgi:WD40 repeat protein
VFDYASRARTHTLADHKAAVHSVQFDDHKIVSAGADNAIKVWNAVTGARMYTLLGGSLQRRANNPPHPSRPGVTEAGFDESRIVASINSLVRVYNFDVVAASASGDVEMR